MEEINKNIAKRLIPGNKRTWSIIGVLAVIVTIFSISVNHHIANAYNDKIYSDPEKIPTNRVGLVLGTAKSVYGRPNVYYQARLDAALTLYRSGKIEKILVSGDNSTTRYDEPTDMKNDLIRFGVDPDDIYLDYAGFRTLDSMVRAKHVFGLSSFTVISQPFHCQRALFIARDKGLSVVGFAARDIKHASRFLLDAREFGARVKAALDVWVLGTDPKFFGEPVVIAGG